LDKEEKTVKKKQRRASVALVNALKPQLASTTVSDAKEDKEGSSPHKKKRPVAFQAVSMAIADILKNGR